ncbi:sigma-54-dependent transcriptional regulator [Leptolyngbya sp. 7M]|uniref:sigma-54-dependent transcriptional regulator n=1 Tax=Leptolyngbya sp. 7M TaxID=2812896 RepID=UPI001B8B85B7|nr:sigma-54 dependent transcriptional regulator [Leptolyngbya sp. 7M]QYO65962.1 sigma-54 dependent transcriptional regulator [Leptolyngbya sp. 7M]
MARKSILVVDDEKNQREILETILSGEGYDVTTASSGEAAMKFVESRRFDLVLTDLKMTGMSGLDLLKELTNFDRSIIVILLTAHGSVDSAVDALRLGAFDYLQKPYDSEKLLETVSRALNKLTALDTEIVSVSPEMDKVKKLILKIAKSNSTVLIRGESGTGKELIARSMHKNSLRGNETFQAVNCAAINENLLESELFGHEKGAFTGAVGEKKGLFEIANNGTLFLDEIGELDIALQAKLLRALQEKEIRRVGGVKEIPVDVRVLAATNRDLLKMTEEKRFREDLYYRLNVLSIEIPPLRERRTDIPALIEYFVKKHTRGSDRKIEIDASARELLENYHYPGNVRQLESAIERAILLCENDRITSDDLPPEMVPTGRVPSSSENGDELFKLPPEGVSFEDVEKSLIMQAMERTDGNITKSAKLLGLTFRTLQYRLEKFGIKKDQTENEEDGDS